jgi:hypothetical protein
MRRFGLWPNSCGPSQSAPSATTLSTSKPLKPTRTASPFTRIATSNTCWHRFTIRQVRNTRVSQQRSLRTLSRWSFCKTPLTGVSSFTVAKAGPPAMSAKRGNPNWCKPWPTQLGPPLATEFEMRVRQLNLTSHALVTSTELRTWCERNRNRCYIPEWLLKTWGVQVDPTLK